MLHFFRKIRHDLIANSKFYKYLKYAIGEIVLVVLGILIALYINNQNEMRKEQEKFDEVLVKVEKELIWNITNSIMKIKSLIYRDSLNSIIVFDGLNRGHLEKDTFFQFRRFQTYNHAIEDKSFNRLMEIDNGLTEEQNSISQMLTELYNKDSVGVSVMINNRVVNLEYEYKRSLREHDWYIDYVLNNPYSEKEIDYYLNDPEYKKIVVEYFELTNEDYFRQIRLWFQKFLHSYKKVYSYLEIQNIQRNDSIHFRYNQSDYKHFIGEYKLMEYPSNSEHFLGDTKFIYKIRFSRNPYYLDMYRNDSLWESGEIYPLSKTTFLFKDYPFVGFHRILFDDESEVTGLNFNYGVKTRLKFQKIR